MSDWEAVIGLEIHVQLKTRTKMFCGCELSFGDEPNTHCCPTCLALPGALPVLNGRAIELGLQMGLALGCEIAPRSVFARKNYFYPDSPKAYQISQYDLPLCLGGRLGDVRLHRIHLEEDAAKLTHLGESGRIHGSEASVVDFNRCSTPLAEIVTEPDIHSALEAQEWLELLRETLRQIGVSDVNMEEGSLRCDANVSIRPVGSTELGTKTELKNMNSFRYLRRGVDAEIERQIKILEDGGRVEQETLHFDPASGRLSSLRSKEEAHDYRYFPEPDLVPLVPTDEMIAAARAALPELPQARMERYARDYGLIDEEARQFAFRPTVGAWYEQAVAVAPKGVEARGLANWVRTELLARLPEGVEPADSLVTPATLGRLVGLVADKKLGLTAAKKVLDVLIAEGGDPELIVEREGLGAMESDGGELAAIVAKVIADNPDAADKVRGGNPKAIGALVGPIMRETKGRADGGEVNRLIREQLGV